MFAIAFANNVPIFYKENNAFKYRWFVVCIQQPGYCSVYTACVFLLINNTGNR